MTTKLFIVGRPGSGKSTAAQHISRIVREQHWDVKRTHIDDYPILQKMTKSLPEKFHLKENGGFDALDPSVLDVALLQVEQMVRAIEDDGRERLVTIEFARDDYASAFKLFHPEFIQGSYLLFMHANIETCLRRIHSRVAFPTCVDDHPSFSDEIYKVHYSNDNLEYIRSLQRERQFGFERINIAMNEDSPDILKTALPDILKTALEELVDAILQPLPSL